MAGWMLVVYYITTAGGTGILHVREYTNEIACEQEAEVLEHFARGDKKIACERVGDI